MEKDHPQLQSSVSRVGFVRPLLWLLLIAGCAWRVYYVYYYNPIHSLWSDPGRHWNNGIQPLETTPVVLANPIGFQLWIGMVAKLTLGKPLLTFIYASIMALITPWIWYRFFRELLVSRTLALFGWVLLAWLPSWLGIFSLFMSETLFLPLLGAAFWLTWRCLRKRTVDAFVWASVLWMLAGLTRGIAIPMAAVVMAIVWWGRPQRGRSALVFLAVLAPVLLFLGYRSYVATGRITPVGDGSYDYVYARSGRQAIALNYTENGKPTYAYLFQSPIIGKPPLKPLSDWESKRTGQQLVAIETTDPKPGWAAANQSAREGGGDWLPWACEGLVYLFFAESWPDNNGQRINDQIAMATRWMWAPLMIVAVGGLMRLCRRETLPAGLLFGAFAAWLLVQGFLPIAVNEGRYRKPMEGWTIATLLLMVDRRRARKDAVGVTPPQ